MRYKACGCLTTRTSERKELCTAAIWVAQQDSWLVGAWLKPPATA